LAPLVEVRLPKLGSFAQNSESTPGSESWPRFVEVQLPS
jgi:hypothetical protein